MSKGSGFPLSLQWHQGLWSKWDSLSPEEREDYERHYEDRDNNINKKEHQVKDAKRIP